MKITDEMLPFIEKAMDEAITKAYPKTGGVASVRAKITTATIKGLEQQKESTLSRALFFAAQAANNACTLTGGILPPEKPLSTPKQLPSSRKLSKPATRR